MRLFIPEYPLVEIPSEPDPIVIGKGYVACDKDNVRECFSPILIQASPNEYSLSPKTDIRRQRTVNGNFTKETGIVVNSGDACLEGLFLMEEVHEDFSTSEPVRNSLACAQNSGSNKGGFSYLKFGFQFGDWTYTTGCHRRRDWPYGMKLVSACTQRRNVMDQMP
jgi:hypothetical protein